MIVYHWQVDKAFLMLEFSEDLNPENIVIAVNDNEKSYEVIQIKEHLIVANELYNALLEKQKIEVILEGRKFQLFPKALEKSNFSLVLYDFYRFTNIY